MSNSKYNLRIFNTADDLFKSAAEFIISISNKAIELRGRFVISFSGGQTPEQLYSLLSQSPFRNQLQWGKTFVFWGDERCVPLEDNRNNAYQSNKILLDKIDIPKNNVHRIPVDLSPEVAASNYEKDIKDFFGAEPPRFDLILLGLGNNGHTASLFPGSKILEEKSEGVRSIYVEEEEMFRITMTAPLINQAHNILFLVTGEKKSQILKKILFDSSHLDKYPAQLISPFDGMLTWFIDSAASSSINL